VNGGERSRKRGDADGRAPTAITRPAEPEMSGPGARPQLTRIRDAEAVALPSPLVAWMAGPGV
jgi:hypothetical protein